MSRWDYFWMVSNAVMAVVQQAPYLAGLNMAMACFIAMVASTNQEPV